MWESSETASGPVRFEPVRKGSKYGWAEQDQCRVMATWEPERSELTLFHPIGACPPEILADPYLAIR